MEEAPGEMASEGIESLADEWIMGELGKRTASVQAYIDQGMSREQAEEHADRDILKRNLYAGFIGLVSGGISAGVGYGAGGASNSPSADVNNSGDNLGKITQKDGNNSGLASEKITPSDGKNADAPLMTGAFGPEKIEKNESGVLGRKMRALAAAKGTLDESSITATIGAALAPESASVQSTSTASAAAQHLVGAFGTVPAVMLTENALMTAAENGIPADQAQLALTVAALSDGQAHQALARIAAENSMNAESLNGLIAAAHADMQDETLTQKMGQVVYDNQVATRVAALVADGGLSGIASYETAVQQAHTEVENAQDALESVQRQQRSATDNLQSLYAQYEQEPSNQTLYGQTLQAIKDVEGAAKVVAEYQQSLDNAKTRMQAAQVTLTQMRESTLKKLRQQAQADVDAAREAEQAKAAENQVKYSQNRYSHENEVARTYSYAELTAKPDIRIVTIDSGTEITRDIAVTEGLKNAMEHANGMELYGAPLVFVPDLGMRVSVSKRSLRHGLDRRAYTNAPITTKVGEILENAIVINEADPKIAGVNDAYILLGAAEDSNKQPIYVRLIVNKINGQLEDVAALYALNAKKGTSRSQTAQTRVSPHLPTGSSMTVTDLLDIVKDIFSDSLSNDVIQTLGIERKPTEITGNLRYHKTEQDGIRYSMSAPQQQPQGVSFTQESTPVRSGQEIMQRLSEALGIPVDTRRKTFNRQARKKADGYSRNGSGTVHVQDAQAVEMVLCV